MASPSFTLDGSKWNSGFAASEFITDAPRNLAWSEKPVVLFTNVFVELAEQIVPIMQQIASAGGREFVVIAAGGGKSTDPSGGAIVAFALPQRNHSR